jgi:hypothetical protein
LSMPDDPERLADATSQSQLGELFASASRDLPSDEQLARLASKLGAVLDAPPAPPAPPGASLLVKLGIATGAVALLVGAGLALRRASPPASAPGNAAPQVTLPPASSTPAQPPAAPSALTSAEPSLGAEDPVMPRAAEKPATASSKPTAAPGKALSEAALLEQARRVLNSAPSSALQLANQHRTRFPNGVLTQEREVIAIEALRRMHRSTEADQRATGFSKAFPGSAHQRMVDEPARK